MTRLKQKILEFFYEDLVDSNDYSLRSKVFSFNLMVLSSWFFAVILGTLAYFQNHLVVVIVDIILLAAVTTLFILHRKKKSYAICHKLSVLIVGVFFAYLLATGGMFKSSFVWIFPFPMIAFQLLGSRDGILASLVMLIFISFVFLAGPYLPFIVDYEMNLKIRSIPAYILILLFSYAMDRIRETVNQRLCDSKEILQRTANKFELLNQEKQQLITELENTLGEVKALRTILPICSICKKIRNDKGYWQKVESFFHSHSGVLFSQSLCPKCSEEILSDEKKPESD
jgi:hypothetical protein